MEYCAFGSLEVLLDKMKGRKLKPIFTGIIIYQVSRSKLYRP